VKVILPWPDKGLSPNARLHWAAKAKLKAKARQDATYLAYDAMPQGLRTVRAMYAGTVRIAVDVAFFPPDARHRDDDNMIGMFKAARDGIADALAVDDRRFMPVYRFCDPCAPGRIEVTL
jgi:hypothetical protein